MADLSEQKVKYKHNCLNIEEKCASDSEYYAGQGDYHCWYDCKKGQMVHSDEYTAQYARYYCPIYCTAYDNGDGISQRRVI